MSLPCCNSFFGGFFVCVCALLCFPLEDEEPLRIYKDQIITVDDSEQFCLMKSLIGY